jgi:hypothetical protein
LFETAGYRADLSGALTSCVGGRAPGVQLLGLVLLGRFQKIVSLHEKKPGALSITDRPRFLQVLLGFAPQ